MTGGRWPGGDTGGACAVGDGAAWNVRPRQPGGGIGNDGRTVVQQGAQVVDRIDPVQPTGLDQAAQHIADVGACRFLSNRLLLR